MKNLKLFALIILFIPFILSNNSSITNGEKYIPGEILIQLDLNSDINSYANTHRGMGLKPIEQISKRMNIWLCSFEQGRMEDHAVLEMIRKDKPILNAQFNHFLSTREIIPNDEFFDDQWSLMNTGQGGGVIDADIDVTEAWDITTGGVTALGDTIVLAVIDGGCDMDHPDLYDNLWKNWADTADNGIDDDGNGYIDDFYGWDAYDDDGIIPGHNHGCHVIGIVGAVGDNEIGISGVNINSKVMVIAGSSTAESQAMKAYNYVLDQRSLYNETDGEKGAFVVATNASFGVDNGQPEDFPLWSAVYDSLGLQGVISCGASPNRNWNVDVVGDVPTACPSEFLITVTNTTNVDEKYSSSGWGVKTIDIGAPGISIKSTVNGDTYGFKSGTSMSTPHVTGVIGLLFAAADEEFMLAYKENPAEYALKMKQYVLDGVDPLETLNEVTTSGGRLNAYNSILVMQDPPQYWVDQDTIAAIVNQYVIDSSSFSVSNIAGSFVNYLIETDTVPEWLTFENFRGSVGAGLSDTIQFYFNGQNMESGFYYYDLPVSYDYIYHDTLVVKMEVREYTDITEGKLNSDVIKVYPNPSTNKLSIEFAIDKKSTVEVSLLDLNGRQISQLSNSTFDRGNHQLEFYLRDKNIVAGTYFIDIKTNGISNFKKLIIQ